MKINYELFGLNWTLEEKKEHETLMKAYEDTGQEVIAYIRLKTNVPAIIKDKHTHASSELSLFLNRKRIPCLIKNKHLLRRSEAA